MERKPMIVKDWDLNKGIDEEAISGIATWIRLPNLNPRFWSASSLGKIRRKLGRPVKADAHTSNITRLAFACILV